LLHGLRSRPGRDYDFWHDYGNAILLDLTTFDRWAEQWRIDRAPMLPPTLPDRPAEARSLRKRPERKPHAKGEDGQKLGFSEYKAIAWYEANRANLVPRPTEKEDHAALNKRFNNAVPRATTRAIRRHFFPNLKPGPRGPRRRPG